MKLYWEGSKKDNPKQTVRVEYISIYYKRKGERSICKNGRDL